MKKKFVLFISLIGFQISLQACGGLTTQVYGGEITYALNSANPLECTATFTFLFDIPDNVNTDSIWVDWGDGYNSYIFATQIIPDSTHPINGAAVLYKHVYQGMHQYASPPPNGFYTISPLDQYRLFNANNIYGGNSVTIRYYIEANVAIDTNASLVNWAPILSAPGVGIAYTGNVFNQANTMFDTDGDSLFFDFAVPLVNKDVTVPAYLFPDQYCGGGNSTFVIDHGTGQIIWDMPCQQGVFSLAIVVRKYRNGILIGSIMRDEIVYVLHNAISDVSSIPLKDRIQVYPNPANSFIQVQTDRSLSIFIADILGKTILKQNIQSASAIDISTLSSGMYFIRDETNSLLAKFVKQ
jgi:hypothetical protein